MNTFELPALPAGIVLLLGFLAPYGQALINRPEWPARLKKIISLVTSLVVAGFAMVLYYFMSGDLLPSWPAFVILAIMASQTSFTLVTKRSANQLEDRVHAIG